MRAIPCGPSASGATYRLTPRSRSASTAVHQARSGYTQCIFSDPGWVLRLPPAQLPRGTSAHIAATGGSWPMAPVGTCQRHKPFGSQASVDSNHEARRRHTAAWAISGSLVWTIGDHFSANLLAAQCTRSTSKCCRVGATSIVTSSPSHLPSMALHSGASLLMT